MLKSSLSDLRFIFFVAFRYLFSKKKQSAINLISIVSVFGVVVSTAALVCVMSVFNGFSDMFEKSIGDIASELQITAKRGKTFDFSKIEGKIAEIQNIAVVSQVIQDNALIDYNSSQTPIILKGVDKNYKQIINADSLMISGSYRLYDFEFDVSVVGYGLAYSLNLGVDYITPLSIYAPRREGKINIARPDAAFKRGEVLVSGLFASLQTEFDDKMIIAPIEFVKNLYDYDSVTVSAVELKLKDIKHSKSTENRLHKSLGEEFLVQNRHEQQKDYFKIIRIERLIIFIILAFILFIAICNIISSLSITLIEKKDDIQIFKNIGANSKRIRQIFIVEGWLMSIIGAIVGVILGLITCFLQYKFGFIKMGDASYVENYPVVIQFTDIFAIFLTVLIIGFLAAFYPVKYFLREKEKSPYDTFD
jgi:ABC-type lipoprotein release transport system permease subunit